MGYHTKEKLRISKATHQTNFQMLMKKVKNYNFANNTCEIFFKVIHMNVKYVLPLTKLNSKFFSI